MIQLNAEQEEILQLMCDESTNRISTCCIISAFGGFGKTNLISAIAQERFKRGMGCSLLITFAKKLKETLRSKSKLQEGLVVENVHSLIRNELNRGQDCANDNDMERYLTMDPKPSLHPDFQANINLVIFDEMQDMTPNFHKVMELVRQLFAPKVVSFLGMGDFFQAEHQHIGSSTEYMTNAHLYFAHERFHKYVFRGSFRLGHQKCSWLNANLNPCTIEKHYPECWKKYGKHIEEYWGSGVFSYKCLLCDQLHSKEAPCQPQLGHNVRLMRNKGRFNKDNKPLPEMADEFVHKTNAIIFLNGRKQDKYTKYYAHVTSPFAFKGCETKNAVIVGFDYFTERLCAQKANKDNADWPFVLFCQMFVSFTRASDEVVAVIDGSSDVPFFTMRSRVISMEPLSQISSQKKRSRQDDKHQRKIKVVSLQSVFHGLNQSVVENLLKFVEVKQVEHFDGFSNWIVTLEEKHHFEEMTLSMQQFCKYLVLAAVYAHAVRDMPLPTNWARHVSIQAKRKYSISMHDDYILANWCKKKTACVQHVLQHLQLSYKFGTHESFVFGCATGTIDLFSTFGCVFVNFEPSDSRTLLRQITSFLCCKFRALQLHKDNPARLQLFACCHVVTLTNCVVQEVTLNVHANLFLNHLQTKYGYLLFESSKSNDVRDLLLDGAPIQTLFS